MWYVCVLYVGGYVMCVACVMCVVCVMYVVCLCVLYVCGMCNVYVACGMWYMYVEFVYCMCVGYVMCVCDMWYVCEWHMCVFCDSSWWAVVMWAGHVAPTGALCVRCGRGLFPQKGLHGLERLCPQVFRECQPQCWLPQK